MVQNCQEYKSCGREPNGSKVELLGVCPAVTDDRADGINEGQNGGRACWAITGTLCGGVVQGTFAVKLGNCMACDFYKVVQQEQGTNWVSTAQIIELVGKQ